MFTLRETIPRCFIQFNRISKWNKDEMKSEEMHWVNKSLHTRGLFQKPVSCLAAYIPTEMEPHKWQIWNILNRQQLTLYKKIQMVQEQWRKKQNKKKNIMKNNLIINSSYILNTYECTQLNPYLNWFFKIKSILHKYVFWVFGKLRHMTFNKLI